MCPDTRDSLKGLLTLLLLWLLMGLLMFLLSACGHTKYVEVPVTKTEVIHKTDTIERRDSVYVYEGDSISVDTINRILTLYKWRELYSYSTDVRQGDNMIVKIDSVSVPYPVEKSLSLWQRIRIDAFFPMLLAILGLGAFIWYKRK